MDEEQLAGAMLGNRYRVLRLVANGGMGLIYEAEHTTLGRRVAIKVLKSALARDEANVVRFIQEAKAASSIQHPNVVSPLDFDRTPNGSVFFSMELLQGEDLAARLARDRILPLDTVQDIALQIVRGLAAAHAKGVIHRDMKPANIFLTPRFDGGQEVKLLDFGIAKVRGPISSRSITGQGSVFGTARYMSPEQASGLEADPRSDVYAVGIVLYEMLTGTVPFDSDNFMQVAKAHMSEPVPPISSLAPGIPDGVCEMVMRAIAKSPDDRYPDMLEFEAAIDGAFIDTTRVLFPTPSAGQYDDFIGNDDADRTQVFDRREPHARRPIGSMPIHAPSVVLDDSIEPTVVKPLPAPPEVSRPRPGLSSNTSSLLPAGAIPTPVEYDDTTAFTFDPPRRRDASFFAPSTRRDDGHDPGSVRLPRGLERPPEAIVPIAHHTLPPVDWKGRGPNPVTVENSLGGGQAAETQEFVLNLPKNDISRNSLVAVVASAALLIVALGVAAWMIFVAEDDAIETELHPAVLQEQPRRRVTPPPLEPEPSTSPVVATPEPKPTPVNEPEQVVEHEEERPRRRRSQTAALSDADLSRGFAKVRGAISACGKQHGGLPGTGFDVHFTVVEGRPRDIEIQSPHHVTPLGRCVKQAVADRARFPRGRPTPRVTKRARF